MPSLISRGREFYSFDHFTDFNTDIGVRIDPSLNMERFSSEGEWWAACGRFKGSFVRAEEPDDSRSWFVKEMDVELSGTHPVGADNDDLTMQGFFDMDGNVEEWTDSPACSRAEACGSFDRVILGGRTVNGDQFGDTADLAGRSRRTWGRKDTDWLSVRSMI